MRAMVYSIALLVLLASPAPAGRNANGALVVHSKHSLDYTACDLTAPQNCGVAVPGSCADLVTMVDGDVPTIFVFASFTELATPGISKIRFGITHNLPGDGYWISSRCSNPCIAGSSEFPDADWPLGGDDGHSGNTILFDAPVYDRFFKFYYFVLEEIYFDGGSYFFATSPYGETEPALFYDDGTPPTEDVCTNFGMVRWLEPGHNDCPQIPPSSADESAVRIEAAGPNPCVGRATVRLFLTESGAARVEIVDLQGRRVATLADGILSGGAHELVWDAAGASSGVYFARVTTPRGDRSTKLILLE